MIENLSELQETYLEVAAHVAVLNLLVTTVCAQLILKTEDPKYTLEELESAVRETIRRSITEVPATLKYRPQMLQAHSDALDNLFESIRNRAGLEDVKQSNE